MRERFSVLARSLEAQRDQSETHSCDELPNRGLKGRIRLVRRGREPKGFAESSAQWRSRCPEEPHQSPIAQIISPLGFSQIVANQSQNFAGDSFIPGATSEPFRNFVAQVVRPFFRQFEHLFKVSQGLLVGSADRRAGGGF